MKKSGFVVLLTTTFLMVFSQVSALSVSASSNDGNIPENTLDSNFSTRWSALGVGQWIRYDLGNLSHISNVSIAFYQGDIRRQNFTISVSVNGSTWQRVHSNIISSGNTLSLENYPINRTVKYLKITGYGNSVNNWNSITEVKINLKNSSTGITNSSFRIPSSLISTYSSSNDGNIPQNTLDNNLSTRWSALGSGQSITYNLSNKYYINFIDIAFYKGNERIQSLNIQKSTNNQTWTTLYSTESSGV